MIRGLRGVRPISHLHHQATEAEAKNNVEVDRATITALFIPAGIALLVSVGYFALTQNWTALANPVAGTVATVGGVFGFVAGAWLDRRRGPSRATSEAAKR